MSEWIKCSDQSPPKDVSFLCYDPTQTNSVLSSRIYVVHYEEEDNYSKSAYIESGGECYEEYRPTHWMQLPPEPEES